MVAFFGLVYVLGCGGRTDNSANKRLNNECAREERKAIKSTSNARDIKCTGPGLCRLHSGTRRARSAARGA